PTAEGYLSGNQVNFLQFSLIAFSELYQKSTLNMTTVTHRLLSALLLPALIFSTTVVHAQTGLREQLIGQWRNLTLHLKVLDAANPVNNKVYDYDEKNWEDSLKIRPIHTYFKANNSFYSEYYNLKDSLVFRQSGKWALEGDHLTFFYEKPKTDTLYFTVGIKDKVATFHGWVDWNGDGKKDDEYAGTQRKQP
ncbi:MAG: hypothetical protein ABUL46_00850, partial [Chitinophaga rupis]